MPWSFHPARSTFGQFAESWDALNASLLGGHPLFHSEFLQALLTHFGDDGTLLAVHRSADGVDALIPLVRRRFGWRTFIPAQTQVSPMLAATPAPIGDLPRRLPGVALSLDLLCQDPDCSPWLDVLDGRHVRTIPHTHTMNIDLEGDFETYLLGRNRKVRETIRRKIRRTSENFAIDLRLVTSPDEMPAAVERYGKIESSGWKGQQGTAVHSSNVQGRFYVDVFTSFARRGQATVYELYLDDALVASKLTVSSDRMIVNLKKAYVEDFQAHSPGRLLDYMEIEREFSEGRYSVMEYYTNAHRDDLSWASSDRYISHVTIYRSPAVASLYSAYGVLKQKFSAPAPQADSSS